MPNGRGLLRRAYPYVPDARTTCPVPGVGVGRMIVTSFASFLLLWEAGYEPRHRSKRAIGIGRLAGRQRRDPFSTSVSSPAEPGWLTGTTWMPSPPAEPPVEPEFADWLESDRLRRVLERWPLDELTRIIPEILQVIADSSVYTMTTAWNDFREATGNNPQEDAVVIRLGRAHDPWWLITNGPVNHAIGAR